jgi:hypothetical protein
VIVVLKESIYFSKFRLLLGNIYTANRLSAPVQKQFTGSEITYR